MKAQIDDLQYTYNGNVLTNVEDVLQKKEGFDDGITSPLIDDYNYNEDGSLIEDMNKEISEILYHPNGMPSL
ncbi:MAG: hypothetical protein OEW75_07160 [Cyclobacteriaceae bacterium]|nr:hypothetical protein [Cyclobacteriaceae bacterium]